MEMCVFVVGTPFGGVFLKGNRRDHTTLLAYPDEHLRCFVDPLLRCIVSL